MKNGKKERHGEDKDSVSFSINVFMVKLRDLNLTFETGELYT